MLSKICKYFSKSVPTIIEYPEPTETPKVVVKTPAELFQELSELIPGTAEEHEKNRVNNIYEKNKETRRKKHEEICVELSEEISEVVKTVSKGTYPFNNVVHVSISRHYPKYFYDELSEHIKNTFEMFDVEVKITFNNLEYGLKYPGFELCCWVYLKINKFGPTNFHTEKTFDALVNYIDVSNNTQKDFPEC
jgi:hypothetical protein